MRVGINCLGIDPSFVGGVNSFTLGLLQGFAGVADNHTFQLYVTRRNHKLFSKFQAYKNFCIVMVEDPLLVLRKHLCRAALFLNDSNIYKSISDTTFRHVREQMDAESDLLYTPTVTLQCFDHKQPTVLSMHDIQHIHYPEFFTWTRRLSRKITYGLSAGHATYFQASSQFIKEDLLAHFRSISEDQIHVIPEGVLAQEFTAQRSISLLRSHHDLPERFLFLPAQLWPHKNHETLLKALKELELNKGLRIPLVLTGAKYAAAPRIFRFIHEHKMEYVRYLGKVSFDELVSLYQNAAALVMPSLYESNSLPILEAAASGTPILAARIPPNEELASTLHLNMFDPVDHNQLAEQILWLWQNYTIGLQQAERNRMLVSAYSWDRIAAKYLTLFETALHKAELITA